MLCGSLKEGCDGVGDYTRRLAGQIMSEGHTIGIIALNDQHILKMWLGEQQSGGYNIPVLRLPSCKQNFHQFKHAESWLKEFNPDWISLQYVPFSFNAKGLPFNFARELLKLAPKRQWHIMFHELWVGMHNGASTKESLWGQIQRQLILSMIRKLQPNLIHTQSSLYKKQLEKMGFEAHLLPLFSNIPVAEKSFESEDKARGILQKGRKIYFVIFGGVHKGGPVIQFAEEIKAYSDRAEIPVSLLIVGRGGSEQKYWEKTWTQLGLEVEIMGELPELQLSEILSRADFGITTTVFSKVEKSGSVAAMKDHGLKIICVAADWKPRGMPQELEIPGVVEYKKGGLDKFFQADNEPGAFSKVKEVSNLLIAAFGAKKSN